MDQPIQSLQQQRYPFLLQLPYLKPFSRLLSRPIILMPGARKNQRPRLQRPLKRTRQNTLLRPRKTRQKLRPQSQIRPRTHTAGDPAEAGDLAGVAAPAGDQPTEPGIHTFTWLVLVPLSLICVLTTMARSVTKSLC